MGSTSTRSIGERDESTSEVSLVQQVGGALEDEGRRILVEAPLVVGRANPLFAERYPTLSRQHAEIVRDRDRLRIADLGSRHGVFVNGLRVERATLSEGDFVALGSVSFFVVRAPDLWVASPCARLPHASHGFARVLDEVRLAARSTRPLTIVGEPGVGKSALAAEIVGSEADAPWDLSERAAAPPTSGPLVADRLDEASEEAQRSLLAALRRAGEPRGPRRVIVLSCAAPATLAREGRLLAPIAPLLDGWVVEVPPLRARPEDILPIARVHLAHLGLDPAMRIEGRLLLRLAREPWRGNVRSLLTEIERLVPGGEGGALEDRAARGAGSAGSGPGTRRVAADGSWIEGPDGVRRPLDDRRVLRAVLRALADARASRGGAPLAHVEIGRAAWPAERVDASVLANRVWVAMSSLRKLGLGACLVNTAEGYVLTESVEVVATAPPPAAQR
jgi:hypothetical protein